MNNVQALSLEHTKGNLLWVEWQNEDIKRFGRLIKVLLSSTWCTNDAPKTHRRGLVVSWMAISGHKTFWEVSKSHYLNKYYRNGQKSNLSFEMSESFSNYKWSDILVPVWLKLGSSSLCLIGKKVACISAIYSLLYLNRRVIWLFEINLKYEIWTSK